MKVFFFTLVIAAAMMRLRVIAQFVALVLFAIAMMVKE